MTGFLCCHPFVYRATAGSGPLLARAGRAVNRTVPPHAKVRREEGRGSRAGVPPCPGGGQLYVKALREQ